MIQTHRASHFYTDCGETRGRASDARLETDYSEGLFLAKHNFCVSS